jgi:hypothetical protein
MWLFVNGFERKIPICTVVEILNSCPKKEREMHHVLGDYFEK